MVARLTKVVQIFPLIYKLAVEDFGAMELRWVVYSGLVEVVRPFLCLFTTRLDIFLL